MRGGGGGRVNFRDKRKVAESLDMHNEQKDGLINFIKNFCENIKSFFGLAIKP